jgi:ABC-type nickel/cobalt efflux system permease component RcnA
MASPMLADGAIQFSSIVSATIVGLIIGLRHSTDGDHIVAVATMARDNRNVFKGLWIGVSWGLGHSTPLLILGVFILIFKEAVLDIYESVSSFFEFGVAIMLIFLGIQVFWKMKRGDFHVHAHEHDKGPHNHLHGTHSHEEVPESPHKGESHGLFPQLIPFFRLKSYLIGIVHGLAGSAAVMLAILPTTNDFVSGILFLMFFSIGTMISMALFTILIAIPFAMPSRSGNTGNILISIAGILSILLGLALGSDLVLGTDFTGILWY